MNEEKKICLDEILRNLQNQLHYKHGMITCKALFGAWLTSRKLPKLCKRLGTKPPARQTILHRRLADGYTWLKLEEVYAFEEYAGYKLYENR